MKLGGIFAIIIAFLGVCGIGYGQNWIPGRSIGTANGVYSYSYNQTPSQLVEITPFGNPNTGITYQWYSSTTPTSGFVAIPGATSMNYQPAALTSSSVTTYYYRSSTSSAIGSTDISNTVKIQVVSANWEDLNYVREHNVLVINQTTWTGVDQLPIGSKLQTTTYFDGLGRGIEKVSRQTATPPSGSSTWGDLVQFSVYDQYGRESVKYLPYSSNSQIGKFKTTTLTDQSTYYSNASTYNETSAFSSISFDNSPLNRVINVKEPGSKWAASAGSSVLYDMNTVLDNVQIWDVDYTQGDAPVNKGAYAANLLYKITYTDVNGNQVIQFSNKSGQLILKKVQLVASPTDPYTGWICTYSVYDDFGLLRYQIQPEGVNWLYANSWNFAAANGSTILAEQVFQYNYDDKGRTIWKKAPGASALNMIYDVRDRMVFMQDGNQAALSPTPQWTTNLYDVLDRPVLSTLFNTTETIANLQTDLANASATSAISITAAANTGGATISTALSLCPTSLNATSLNSSTSTSVLKYLFYDGYSFPGVKTFNTTYTNLSAYSTSDPNVIPIASSQRVLSVPTGSLVRVLNSTSTFLATTNYIDEKGRQIQTLEDNIRSGVDITTMQYHFDGRLLSSCNSHTNASAGYSAFITLNKYIYDAIGRVDSIQKQLGSNAMATVLSYEYDDLGRVKKKHLAPGYSNPTTGLSELESLGYSFNIHGQITGINRDYALKTAGVYSKWGHYFGLYVGYDNKDNAFTTTQLNGQVGALMWNTQGDDAQRKYEYVYDNAGRLTNANFAQQQHIGDGWSNSSMDFSVGGVSGKITYDNNGNLLTMMHKGVMPGQSAPITVDDLRYTYNTFSNKLSYVTDQTTATAFNGLFGDFKDGSNAAGTPDYVYDNNGNVVVDLNKASQNLTGSTNGIHYNFLDKPDQIRIVGKGTILIAYSADGEKLQRAFIPEAGGSSSVTSYVNQYIYQETATLTTSSLPPFTGTSPHLAFINFEGGRIRAMTPVSTSTLIENGNITLPAAPSGGYNSGAWDFFITDYQQNVRMILTEETHAATNNCTMETANASSEDPIFGQTGASNEVEVTRIAKPTGWTGNSSASVSHLGNTSGHTLGPNTLQKVMAGDIVSAQTDYYYQGSYTSSNPNIVTNLLTSLSSLIGGGATAGMLTHGAASNISTQLSGVPGFTSAIQPNNNTSGLPQAYITVLFFDERFNFISAADGGVYQTQVRSADAGNANPQPLLTGNAIAPKNGYVYVYVSNRSDQDVYFDNFKVTIQAASIIEENHYYSFGLKIAAISSKKLGDAGEGKLKNPYQYNGKEMLDEDADLNWYDYGFRSYDPQIGRFPQLDPLTDSYPFLTPYQYASNDPITNIDVDGLEGCPATAGIVGVGSGVSNSASLVANITSAIQSVSKIRSVASIFISLTRASGLISGAIKGQDIINNRTITYGVGSNGLTISEPAGGLASEELISRGGPSFSSEWLTSDEKGSFEFPSENIFWEEGGFPEIEFADGLYADIAEQIFRQRVVLDSRWPQYRFLVFHYSPLSEKNRASSMKANRGNLADRVKRRGLFERHEVPYASTIEGGSGAMTFPMFSSQNQDHGRALANFYRRNGFIGGEEFRVPLPLIKFPKHSPLTVPKSVIDRIRETTGLTGAALLLYIILSEGSRAFPLRNLVPIL